MRSIRVEIDGHHREHGNDDTALVDLVLAAETYLLKTGHTSLHVAVPPPSRAPSGPCA